MLMQALQAGGMPVFCDELRPADEHNPRGYLEYHKIPRLAADNSWLGEAEGKAIKVVSQLLYHLPPTFEYRVIFMRRELAEVLHSQDRMLASRQSPGGPAHEAMRTHFARHLEKLDVWLAGQSHMRVMPCPHREMVSDPLRLSAEIAAFLEIPLDTNRMAAIVDPALYRQRV